MESSSPGERGAKSSLSRKFSGATVSPRKGVQKFYTKIRHKIEDSMPPKISAKLGKNTATRNSSEQSKPIPPPRGLTANKKQKRSSNSEMESDANQLNSGNIKVIPNHNSSSSYENIKISNNPNGLADSDEDCRTSLNDSTLSLEDEIFEELEKVAHDEAKLNAVLKNFDKILADFTAPGPPSTLMTTSTPALKVCNNNNSPTITKAKKTNVKTEGKSPASHKPLQKSKTCSIIESRCILKKCISDPTQTDERNIEPISISNDLQHFAALQVTKSLWNLQDFETFAKSGKKFEKFDCRLPILKTCDNSSYKLGKSLSNPQTTTNNKMKQIIKVSPLDNIYRSRSHLPKATSVWEVSQSASSMNSHPLCTRTSSGSKIPIKKITPQRLAYSGRSNSFCDQSSTMKTTTNILSPSISSKVNIPLSTSTSTTISSSQKIVQVGKVLPTPKRNPGKITTVNKIVKNLNELNISGDITKTETTTTAMVAKKPGSTISSLASSSATIKSITTATGLANRKQHRHITSASSTPHSLNKIGISVKSLTTSATLSSSTSSSSTVAPLTTNSSSRVTMSTKTPLKSANSELSLNILKSTKGLSTSTSKVHYLSNKNKSQESDLLLNKCLEKGQEILRKVEAFGSVTKLERGGCVQIRSSPVQIQSKYQKESKDAVSSSTNNKTIVKCMSQSQTSSVVTAFTNQKQQNQNANEKKCIKTTKDKCTVSSPQLDEHNKVDYNDNKLKKQSSTDTVDGCSLSTEMHQNKQQKHEKSLPQHQIHYAKECTIEFPRLESCKIIPPLLCHPSQQHAELLVNVKTTQQPLRVHQDSMLCINSDIIRSEKDYHSDCSEDSGHISNENDELTPLLNDNNYEKTAPNSVICSTTNPDSNSTNEIFLRNQKGIKISELLEKFESVKKRESISSTMTTTTTTNFVSSQQQHQTNNPINNKKKCTTTIKVAEVKPVKCITSSIVDIYPTYSSEVIIQIQ